MPAEPLRPRLGTAIAAAPVVARVVEPGLDYDDADVVAAVAGQPAEVVVGPVPLPTPAKVITAEDLAEHRHIPLADAEEAIQRSRQRAVAQAGGEGATAERARIFRSWRDALRRRGNSIEVVRFQAESRRMGARAADGGRYMNDKTIANFEGAEPGAELHGMVVATKRLAGQTRSRKYLREARKVYWTMGAADNAYRRIEPGEVPAAFRLNLNLQMLQRGGILRALQWAAYYVPWQRMADSGTPPSQMNKAMFEPAMVPVSATDDQATKQQVVMWRALSWVAQGVDNEHKRPLVMDYLQQHGLADIRPGKWRPCPIWLRHHWPRLRAVLDAPFLFPTGRTLLTGSEKEMTDLAFAKEKEVQWDDLKHVLAASADERGGHLDTTLHIPRFVAYALMVMPIRRKVSITWQPPRNAEPTAAFKNLKSPMARRFYMIFYAALRYGIEKMGLLGLREWHDRHRANPYRADWGYSDPVTDIVEACIHSFPIIRESLDAMSRARAEVRRRLKEQRKRDRENGDIDSAVEAGDDADEADDVTGSHLVDEATGRVQIGFDVFKKPEALRRGRKKRRKKKRPRQEREDGFGDEADFSDAQRRPPRDGPSPDVPHAPPVAEVQAVQLGNAIATMPTGVLSLSSDSGPSIEEQSAAASGNADVIAEVEKKEAAEEAAEEASPDAIYDLSSDEKTEEDEPDGEEVEDDDAEDDLWEGTERRWAITPSSAQTRLIERYLDDAPQVHLAYQDVGTGKTLTSTLVAAALATGKGVRRVLIMCLKEVVDEFVSTIAGSKNLFPFYNGIEDSPWRVVKGGVRVVTANQRDGPPRTEITLANDEGEQLAVHIATYSQWASMTQARRHWWEANMADRVETLVIVDELHVFRNWLTAAVEVAQRQVAYEITKQSEGLRALVNCMVYFRPTYVYGMTGTPAYDNAYDVCSALAWLTCAAYAHNNTDEYTVAEYGLGQVDEQESQVRVRDAEPLALTFFMQEALKEPQVLQLYKAGLFTRKAFYERYFTKCNRANLCDRFDAPTGRQQAMSTAKTLLERPLLCPDSKRLEGLVKLLSSRNMVDWQPRTDTRTADGRVYRVFPKEVIHYMLTPMTPEQHEAMLGRQGEADIEEEDIDNLQDAAQEGVGQARGKLKSLMEHRQMMNVYTNAKKEMESSKITAIVAEVSQEDPVEAMVPSIVYSFFVNSGIRPLAIVLGRNVEQWAPAKLGPEQVAFLMDSASQVAGSINDSSLFDDYRNAEKYRYAFFTESSMDIEGFGADRAGRAAFKSLEADFKAQKRAILRLYNHIDNKDGLYVRVFCITPKAATGVDFKRTKSVRMMEPGFNDLGQVRGRGARRESHAGLPEDQKVVHHKVYVAMHLREDDDQDPEDVPRSVDERLLGLSRIKMHEVCALNAVLMAASRSCESAKGEYTPTRTMTCFAAGGRNRANLLREMGCNYCTAMDLQYQRAPNAAQWTVAEVAEAMENRQLLLNSWSPKAPDRGGSSS